MNTRATMKKSSGRIAVAMLVLVAFAAAGCGSDATPTSPAIPALPAVTTQDGGAGSSVLSAEVLDAMNRTLQDEYHAEFVYLKVIEKFGDVQPFSNLIFAEERHSVAIAKLFTTRSMAVPVSLWSLDNVPVFASIAEACAGAVTAELENIELYDEFMTWDLPQDVRNVFTSNRAASLDNHLPAFQSCCACTQ